MLGWMENENVPFTHATYVHTNHTTQHMFTSFLLSSVKHWEKVKPISTAHETSMTSIKHYCLLVAKLMKSQSGLGIALILCVCLLNQTQPFVHDYLTSSPSHSCPSEISKKKQKTNKRIAPLVMAL